MFINPKNFFFRYREKLGLSPGLEMVIRNKKCIIIIPKSGSNTLRQGHLFPGKSILHILNHVKYIRTASDLEKYDINEIIFFIRDPIDRFIASYIDRIEKPNQHSDSLYWMKKVNSFIDKMIQAEPDTINKHFRPQFWFIEQVGSKIPVNIYLVNDMNKYFGENMDRYNVSKIKKPELDIEIVKRLNDFYSSDINILNGLLNKLDSSNI
jgi:hypothetical protein